MKRFTDSKIFKNFSWLMGDKIARMVVNLVVSVMVARYLGPEQFGYWNYLLSFALFFSVFSSIGMDVIVPRELVKNNEKDTIIVSTIFSIKLIGGVIGFGLSLLTYFLYKQNGFNDLAPLSIVASLMIFQAFDVFDYYFKSRLQAKYVTYGRNVAFLLISLFKIYLIWAEAPLIYFITTNALEILLGGILVYIFFRKKVPEFNISTLDWPLGKKLLNDGIPIAISGLLILIYMRIDQVMVTDMIDEKANGIYSTGVKMIEVLYFIPMALGESFFPGIVYAKKENEAIYNKNILSFYSIMTFIGLVFTIGTVVVAIPLMLLLFGTEFLGSGEVLLVYGLTIYGTFIGIAVGKYLAAENLMRIILFRSIIGVVINLVLNFIMIPKYGYIGAAYASLISYYVVTLSLLLFKDSRPQVLLLIKALNPMYALEKIKEK